MRFGAAGELQQLAPGAVGAALRVGAGAEVEGDGVVVVALVEDGAAADFVHVLVVGLIHGGAAAQRGGGRGRTGRHAAQQRQRRPVAHAAAALAAVLCRHIVARKGQDVVEEGAVLLAEGVGGFLVLALGKGGVGFEVVADVGAPALHEVARELAADAFALGTVQVEGQVGEVAVEQAQQRAERLLVAAVGRGRDEHEVPRRVCRHPTQQLEALLPSAADATGQRAAVGLVHDDELGALEHEVLGAARRLDEVGGDDGEAVPVEHRDARAAGRAPGAGWCCSAPARPRCGTSQPARAATARPGAAGTARPGAGSRRGPAARAR